LEFQFSQIVASSKVFKRLVEAHVVDGTTMHQEIVLGLKKVVLGEIEGIEFLKSIFWKLEEIERFET
jgi:hypothetical protein